MIVFFLLSFQHFTSIQESAIAKTMAPEREVSMTPLRTSLHAELAEAGAQVEKEHNKKTREILKGTDLTQFAIKGTEEQWNSAMANGTEKGTISIKG